MKTWIIAAAVLLGLCVLNASMGDTEAEAKAAAEHKAETMAHMRRIAKLQALEKRADEMLALHLIRGKP